MGIYTLLLQKRGKILDEQRFLTVTILTLTQKHKERAIEKICEDLKQFDYEFVQISRMRFLNFFRFL